MFRKISLSESKMVALKAALEIIRGCGLQISTVWGLSKKDVDIGDWPIKFCRFTRWADLGTDDTGTEMKTINLEFQYDTGNLFVSVNTRHKSGGNWYASSGVWTWYPSYCKLTSVSGRWFTDPISFHCTECGKYDTTPRCFHGDICPHCGGGQGFLKPKTIVPH